MINLRSLRSAAVLLLGLFIMTAHARAQGTGRVVGRVVDAVTGAGISAAQVQIAESTIGTLTALDGRYILLGVPAGQVTIRVSSIGYSTKLVVGIAVTAGSIAEQNVTLDTEAVQLGPLQVSASAERGSVNRALDQQRTSTGIVNAIAAEQMARSPDSDAGQAVRRVSGVTVQDDKYVFVRGLGERYTTTSLNGTRIPSPEPERKVVPLDLFPSSLLETITTSKSFTPEQPGDFSGGQVNLKTREFPTGRKLTFSASSGYNTESTGQTIAKAPTVGPEWIGMAGIERSMPDPVVPVTSLVGKTPAEVNELIASFRNVWSASAGRGRPSGSMSASLGGEDPIFGQPIGYLASLTYSNTEDLHADERRAVAVSAGTNGETRPQNSYRGSTGSNSVLWGGILNFGTRIGTSTKLSLDNTYTRSSDNQAEKLAGSNEEFGRTFDITRLTFTERTVRSSQISGQHLLADRHLLNWSATSAGVTRYEPDRSDLVYEAAINPQTNQVNPVAWFGAPRTATRTFSDLSENSLDFSAGYRFALGADRQSFLKFGGLARSTDRDADSRAFDLVNLDLSDSERSGDAENVLSTDHARDGRLTIFLNANGGRYEASEKIYAGYGQFEVRVGSRISLVGGARVERAEITVDTRTSQGVVSTADLNNTDVLPSLAVNVELTPSQNLRLSASQTLSRPEYRELSEVAYFDILGGLTVFGNKDLKRALIQNYDIRWEWYPAPGEAISIGAFAKRFKNPIEKVIVGTTGASALSFVNANGADNFGVELEARKGLSMLGSSFEPFAFFANATLMKSSIEPGNEGVSSLTNADRPMVGQAGYVVNAGLSYARAGRGLNVNLLYNIVGRRIIEAGTLPLPDAYEEARNALDLSVEAPILNRVSMKFNARNLLDSPYKTTQGSVIREYFRTGRSFSLGFSWAM